MGIKPVMGPVLDVKDADPERQRMYGGLVAVEAKPAEAVVEEPEVSQEPEPVLCPHCRMNVNADPNSPDDEDKKEFVRAILGNRTYIKKYRLFGNMTVRMTSWTTRLAERMYMQLNSDMDEGILKSREEWDVWRERYRLLLCLESAEADDSRKILDRKELPVESKEWRSLVEERFLGLPEPLYRAFMDLGRKFEGHLDSLMKRASSADFWPTVGRESR